MERKPKNCVYVENQPIRRVQPIKAENVVFDRVSSPLDIPFVPSILKSKKISQLAVTRFSPIGSRIRPTRPRFADRLVIVYVCVVNVVKRILFHQIRTRKFGNNKPMSNQNEAIMVTLWWDDYFCPAHFSK